MRLTKLAGESEDWLCQSSSQAVSASPTAVLQMFKVRSCDFSV
uniref:Uncharacterized protein n=1 Tax=Anguilla anguilla TaxID=7936 RepID=A0A0E9R199_ANGAN